MKKSFIILATLAMTFVSCNKFEKERQQIADRNREAFEKYIGGTVDPEQDWNLATSDGITVNTATSSEIRVYAYDGSSNKLVGSYTVNGSEKVKFDVAENVNEVYVADMTAHKAQRVALGGTADFTGTATKACIGESDGTVDVEKIDSYMNFNYKTDINDVFNAGASHDAADVFYVAFNDFYIYPVYWEAQAINTVGIFYYTSDGTRKEIDLFTFDQKGDDDFTQGYVRSSGNDSGFGPGDRGNQDDQNRNQRSWKNITGSDPFNSTQLGWDTSTSGNTYRAKGIHVTLPAGTVFGFYNKNTWDGKDNKFYSEAALNSDGKTHSTLFKNGSKSYLAFEDQEIKDTDPGDYNDFAFYIEDANIVPIDNTHSAWTLAIEDMGTENDYDFNDIVMSVSHVAGETTADVEFLAAGGVIETAIYYKDQFIGNIHEKFGQSAPVVVNTYYYDPYVEPVKFTVAVDKDFTMSGTYMGGFTFKNENGTSVVASQIKGSTPQMICVPSSWAWPLERNNITTAYPNFAAFAKDHNSSTDWYKTCEPDYVYKSYLAPTSNL